MKKRVAELNKRIKMLALGKKFQLRIEYDLKSQMKSPRVFIQIEYKSRCRKTGKNEIWRGKKWYLSEHMPDDEIVKTIYCAFEMAVKHEVLEGFLVDGKSLFNPHVNFEELLKISDREVTRISPTQ